MHEIGLAAAVLETALEIAGDRPIVRVSVSAGVGLAASADALAFNFELVASGTAAQGAVLDVHLTPGDRLLVDEVEVGGERPEVLRRDGLEVTEPEHQHAHEPRGEAVPVHPAWL